MFVSRTRLKSGSGIYGETASNLCSSKNERNARMTSKREDGTPARIGPSAASVAGLPRFSATLDEFDGSSPLVHGAREAGVER